MPRMTAALPLAALLAFAASAHADPAGKSTVQETLAPVGGGYTALAPAKGEKYLVRRGSTSPTPPAAS